MLIYRIHLLYSSFFVYSSKEKLRFGRLVLIYILKKKLQVKLCFVFEDKKTGFLF